MGVLTPGSKGVVMHASDYKLIAPQLTDAELVFLTELGRLEREGVEAAMADLNHALLHNDVEAGIRAARRFMSLGVLMGEAQKKVVGL
jgi:hypothetical protein